MLTNLLDGVAHPLQMLQQKVSYPRATTPIRHQQKFAKGVPGLPVTNVADVGQQKKKLTGLAVAGDGSSKTQAAFIPSIIGLFCLRNNTSDDGDDDVY